MPQQERPQEGLALEPPVTGFERGWLRTKSELPFAQGVDIRSAHRVDQNLGFLRGMHAESAQKIGDADDPGAGRGEAEQKIPIQSERPFAIQAADSLVDRAPPEERFLRDVIHDPKKPRIVSRAHPAPDLLSRLVDDQTVSVNRVDAGIPAEKISYELQRAGFEQIVGIQIGHDLAGNPGKALFNRVNLSMVFFARRKGEPVPVAFYDRRALVVRAPVNDRVFQLGIVLRKDALNCGFKIAPLLIAGRYQRDARKLIARRAKPGKCLPGWLPGDILAKQSKLVVADDRESPL